MTLAEYYDRQIPEYYDTMYLDGYTPDQILHAARRKLLRAYNERQEEKRAEVSIETQVREAVYTAMDDLFKDWK